MNTQEETPMDEITLTEMLKELFLHNKQMQDFMVLQKEKLDEKDRIIETGKKQTERLINSFEAKFSNIQVQAPNPDLSLVNQTLASNLLTINQTIEKVEIMMNETTPFRRKLLAYKDYEKWHSFKYLS